MGRHRLFNYEPKEVRDALRALESKANEMHKLEAELIAMLAEIDGRRFFVRYGYRSLRTYMIESLRMTKTQAQQIIIKMRQQQNQETIQPTRQIKERLIHDYRGGLRPPTK